MANSYYAQALIHINSGDLYKDGSSLLAKGLAVTWAMNQFDAKERSAEAGIYVLNPEKWKVHFSAQERRALAPFFSEAGQNRDGLN